MLQRHTSIAYFNFKCHSYYIKYKNTNKNLYGATYNTNRPADVVFFAMKTLYDTIEFKQWISWIKRRSVEVNKSCLCTCIVEPIKKCCILLLISRTLLFIQQISLQLPKSSLNLPVVIEHYCEFLELLKLVFFVCRSKWLVNHNNGTRQEMKSPQGMNKKENSVQFCYHKLYGARWLIFHNVMFTRWYCWRTAQYRVNIA